MQRDGPRRRAEQHLSSFLALAMLCCDPSPSARDTPGALPSITSTCCHQSTRCLSTRCPLQAEGTGTQDSNVTLALGASAWSGMAGGILSLACQPRSWHPPCLGLGGCMQRAGGKQGGSRQECRQECRQQGRSS